MIRFDCRSPESLEETFELLEQYGEEAHLLAGGTALVILMRQDLVQPRLVVKLPPDAGLRGVQSENSGIRIGGLATHRELETSALVRARLPVLADTLRRVATIRIRNQGTLGGNLVHADPNQDPPPTLIALEASVTLRRRSGERQVPLGEFFRDYYETVLEPGEVLTSISIPALPARTGAVYCKFLPRTADDYATVAVSAVLTLDEAGETCVRARIVLGCVGSTPVRAHAAEHVLEGEKPTAAALRAVAAEVREPIDPIADIRGSVVYKRDTAEVWTRRTLEAALVEARAAV